MAKPRTESFGRDLAKRVLGGDLVARWGDDRTFVGLTRRVARYLDPKNRSQKVYQHIADALGGRRTMRMMLAGSAD
jgi:hypothetical protein